MTDPNWLPRGYSYVRELGSGAFGEVALARHESLGRLVAIKRIHRAQIYDDESLQRFRREGRVLAGLHHPAIVRVYDFKLTTDNALLIMEYVPGRPLSDLVDDGALPASQGLIVLNDVAGALAAAAAAGVIHRDVKPANVFVLPDGRAKLGDFGLARAVTDPSVFRTTDGQAGGTPAYFPPEVSQGLCEPDERSDGYSFAVMAYEVLTGRQPFVGDGPLAMIAAHWHQNARAPHEFIPGFPPVASAALLAGLDRAPDRRPLPVALIRALTAIPLSQWPVVTARTPTPAGHGTPAPTRRVTIAPMVTEPLIVARPARRRRRRRVPLLIGTLLLAIVLAVAVTRLVSTKPPQAALSVRSVAVTARPDPPRARCPSAHFDFVAVILTNGSAGKLEVQWTKPDGLLSTVQQISVPSGQKSVSTGLRFAVSGTNPLHGVAVVHVSPGKVDGTSGSIDYVC
ncbi:MAG: serine/threonine-protein kinase [Jatrophihabitantaceae bacterium]